MNNHRQSAPVAVYGWEGDGQYWHGPTELASPKRRLELLDPSHALCTWKKTHRLPDGVPVALAITARDLGDCAVVTIDGDYGEAGPLAILAILPAHRRAAIRPEFPFELTSFVRFFEGPVSTGSELVVHDHILQAIEAGGDHSLVFALCSASCSGDLSIAISEYVEQTSFSVLAWMAARDAFPGPSPQNWTADTGCAVKH